MSRKAKPSKSKQKPARKLPAWLTDRARLISLASTSATVLIAAAIAVGSVVGRQRMIGRLADQRDDAQTVRVVFDWPALPSDPKRTWMDSDSRRDLEAVALSWLKQEPHAIASLKAAQAALMKTGWFADDCTLAREPDGIIRVSGRWRIPAAVIRADGRDRLVAATGERLPVAYPIDASGRKVILGLENAPMPALGERWVDAGAVRAALDLLRFIQDAPGSHQVHAVDISAFTASRRELVLVTDRGTRILWGGPIGVFNPGQARDDEKRSRLTSVYTRYGRVDAGSAYIDISLASGVEIQHPPAEATGR